MQNHCLLIINPGSTSTKVAMFQGTDCVKQENLAHSASELAQFQSVYDQYQFRLNAVQMFLADSLSVLGVNARLHAVVGRGGLLCPLEGGTYYVTERMVADLKVGVQGQHASNLGGLLAKGIADKYGIPAFIVDPVAVDEFEDVARLSGHPSIVRRSLGHALNIKAVARRAVKDLGLMLEESHLILVHLGGGISVAPLRGGRIIDVNNANEMGPFSPERTGGLPCGDVVSLCFSGEYTERELLKLISGQGGMVAYIGTNDAREAYRRADEGDAKAKLVMQAMAYQIAKEIGAMATVLQGRVDAVVFTGGLANSARLIEQIATYVEYIAPIRTYPGEDEMLALAEGACRVLANYESPKIY